MSRPASMAAPTGAVPWGGLNVLLVFVHRYRMLYITACVYLGLLIALAHMPRDVVPPMLIGMLTPPFFMIYFGTLAGFANPDTDLAVETSGYPAFLLRQPVRSLTLAVWPMAGVALWGALVWFLFATLFLHPMGSDTPVWWPMVLTAALGVTLQAILWVPVPAGWVRLLFAITIPVTLVFFAAWASGNNWSAEQIAGVYAFEGLLASCAAIYGVSQARTTGAMRSSAKEKTFKDKARPRPDFRSPEAAQFWLEWKKQGRLLPMISTFVLLLLTMPLFGQTDLYETYNGGLIRLNPWMYTWLPMLPAIPLLFATVLGMGASRSYLRSPEGAYHLFFATRPLSSEAMVRAKSSAILLGVVVSWLLLLVIGLGWLLFPASDGERTGPALMFLIERATPLFWAKGIGSVLLLALWTWRNQAVGLFVEFSSLPNIRGSYAALVSLVSGIFFVLYISNSQYLRRENSVPAVAAVLTAVLLAKIGMAIYVGRSLIAARPQDERFVIQSAGLWCLAGTVFAGVATLLASYWNQSHVPTALSRAPLPILAAFILVPLARPLATRLSIELGRHRP